MALDPKTLLCEAKALQEELVTLRRDLHAHPELGSCEVRTTALIKTYLEELSIEVRPCTETGVLGILYGGKPGKTIGLRADIDALPIQEETGLPFASKNAGVMHACGHDLHTASLMGAAKILSAHRDALCGNVKFFFQTKKAMAVRSAWSGPAACKTQMWTLFSAGTAAPAESPAIMV